MKPAAEGERDWPGLLRRACLVLSRTPAEVVRSVTVSVPLCDAAATLQLLPGVTKRLAEEYDLFASVTRESHSFTVHFSRSPLSAEVRSQ